MWSDSIRTIVQIFLDSNKDSETPKNLSDHVHSLRPKMVGLISGRFRQERQPGCNNYLNPFANDLCLTHSLNIFWIFMLTIYVNVLEINGSEK